GMFKIIGVAPRGFAGVSGQAQFWIPFLSNPAAWDVGSFLDPRNSAFFVIARLAPGVTPERGATISRALGPRVDEQYPESGPQAQHFGIVARTLDTTRLQGDSRRTLFLLFSAVGMVLLVACANVASLFLVRAANRRREIAIRLAIGASRSRMIRQLLVESTMVALLGGVASIAVAAVGVRVISAARPSLWGTRSASGIGTVFTDPIHLNVAALAFTAAVAIATGILFGLAPALQSTRDDVTTALKMETGASTRTRAWRRLTTRDALTALEIALAVVL